MPTTPRSNAEIIAELGPAPTTPGEALRHIATLYADTPDDQLMIQGTYNVYGRGVFTGLTMGDLRAIADAIEALR